MPGHPTQHEKATHFRALHEGDVPFVIANPFDIGSAKILAAMGFAALATSSGGFAGTLGRRDGQVTRGEALAHAQAVVEAVDLPVSADFENGFGHAPAEAAETVSLAIGAGLAGCSIEDATQEGERPLYHIDEAAARMAAAAAAAHATEIPFVLTGRTEGFIRGVPDLDETIARLQAYEAAGADVLMAPALPDLAAVKKVCASLTKPFSFMAGIPGRSFPVEALAAAGVRRISLATSLYRAAMGSLEAAAREVRDNGTFVYVEDAMTSRDLADYMGR
ncbi:MAG: isocitrate lyase/phosphoenolpyruvate mutase family protein [Alphaproteobacteria bacterium]|nr:isocitrate lyase/phosphoenolpyruvate mutase family protein [Alphaproteobacteria bacterium]